MIDDMRALTVLNPWAAAIASRIKPYEFRVWQLPKRFVGVPVVLHAAAAVVEDVRVSVMVDELKTGFTLTFGGAERAAAIEILEVFRANPDHIINGAGLEVVRFGESISARSLFPGRQEIDERMWAWPVEDFKPFDAPIPAKGQQRLWRWNGLGNPAGLLRRAA